MTDKPVKKPPWKPPPEWQRKTAADRTIVIIGAPRPAKPKPAKEEDVK